MPRRTPCRDQLAARGWRSARARRRTRPVAARRGYSPKVGSTRTRRLWPNECRRYPILLVTRLGAGLGADLVGPLRASSSATRTADGATTTPFSKRRVGTRRAARPAPLVACARSRMRLAQRRTGSLTAGETLADRAHPPDPRLGKPAIAELQSHARTPASRAVSRDLRHHGIRCRCQVLGAGADHGCCRSAYRVALAVRGAVGGIVVVRLPPAPTSAVPSRI